MVIAVAAGLASCTAQSPKANLKTDVDSLSYETEIKKVIADAATAKFDLRRVKRKIHACKRAIENRKKEGNDGE